MTFAQISSILALLLAFNVPQTEISNIQALLEPQTVSQVTVIGTTSSSTPTIVINIPLQTSEPVSSGVVQSIPMPLPTCTLTGTSVYYSVYDDSGTISWTTANATSGALYNISGGQNLKVSDMTPIDAGSKANLLVRNNYTFEAKVQGPGGQSICQITLSRAAQ